MYKEGGGGEERDSVKKGVAQCKNAVTTANNKLRKNFDDVC